VTPFGNFPRRQNFLKQGKKKELLLLTGNCFTGTTAGARICAGALAANGEAHAMTTAPNATNVLQTLHGHALLAAKIALKSECFSCHPQFLDIAIAQILNPDIRIYAT
jgi:hypothetical protein